MKADGFNAVRSLVASSREHSIKHTSGVGRVEMLLEGSSVPS